MNHFFRRRRALPHASANKVGLPRPLAVLVFFWALSLAATSAAVNPLDRFADPLPAPPRVPFDDKEPLLRPGEVIVMTGATNGVFEQQRGWLEALLA